MKQFRFSKLVVPITTLAVVIFCMSAGQIVKTSAPLRATKETRTVIVDAGHGGVDGGAVGSAGIIEKDINLSIAQCLRDILTINGYHVIMTRDDDVSLHDPDKNTIRQKKVSDIRNRSALIAEHPEAVFVSVHQNQFGVAKYSGTQIFYSPNNPESPILSKTLQKNFQAMLQPNNSRVHRKAGDNLYLLYHADIPAVMVECGFLSNPEEAKKLSTQEYQQKIAFVIFASLEEYYALPKP